MVAVAVDGGEGGHVEQEAREGVEEVVVEVELRKLGAEGKCVWDGAILQVCSSVKLGHLFMNFAEGNSKKLITSLKECDKIC